MGETQLHIYVANLKVGPLKFFESVEDFICAVVCLQYVENIIMWPYLQYMVLKTQ